MHGDETSAITFIQTAADTGPYQTTPTSWAGETSTRAIAPSTMLETSRTGQIQPEMTLIPALRPVISRPPAAPLTFLVNFTVSTDIVSMYNFTYYQSRHKSRGRLSTYHHDPHRQRKVLSQVYEISDQQATGNYLQQGDPISNSSMSAGNLLAALSGSKIAAWHDGDTLDDSIATGDFALAPPTSYWNGSEYAPPSTVESDDVPEFSDVLCWLADPLFLKTREIWLHLQSAVIKMSTDCRTSMSSEQSHRCLQFFAPPNLIRFTDSFFDDWYPHGPIIHRPTFDPQTAPATLLMAITLMGAAMSPSPDDLEQAREWLDYAEDIAFYHENGLQRNVELLKVSVGKPSILQSAFLMCCIQNWEGTPEARARIRREKYNILTAVSRWASAAVTINTVY